MSRRILLLIPLAVLPLLVFEIATQFGLRDTRAAEVRQEAMRLLDLVESEQQRLVENIRHVLGTVASVGGAELGTPGCQAAFERMKPHLPDYLIVQFADRQGIVRCSTNRQALGAFIGDRPNVQRALAAGAFAVGGYSIARGVGHTIFTFGLPYTDQDGQPAGVLTALLDVRWLKDYLARKPMPPEAAIGLADRDGTILARAPEIPGSAGQPLPPQYRFMLESSQRGIAEVEGNDGVERIVAYSPVGGDVADLIVWVGLGKNNAMGPVEQAMWRTLAVFAGLLGLAVLVALWAVRHVARLREESVRTAVKMARVLESTNDAVMEVDRDWRVTFMNERAKTALARRGDLLGRVFWDAYPELVGTEAWSCCQRAMNAQDTCEFEVAGALSGRWYTARAFPSRDGLAVFLQDVTARKGMEEDLRAAKEEAERASLAKSKFLAAASHDLRQPLQSLFLFAAALHGHVSTESGGKALDTLERNLEALRGLLDSLLDVSRLDADVIRPTIEDFQLASVLEHIGTSFAPVARNKGLDLHVDVQRDVVVRSDRHLLGRMVRNLVENAIKYTEHGGIRLECRVSNGHARIAVHDTGIGIPPDQRDLIFVEFHQVGNPGRHRGQGLGLGLSIVQRLSKLIGHPVTLRSTQGRGSVFMVDVPLGETGAVRAPEPFAAVLPDGAGRLAVLIDDDADVLVGLHGIFHDWGYETVTGTSVDQALERLRAGGRTPAVIVSDYRLGENHTGMEAVRRIREQVGSAVPSVLLTGDSGTDLHAEAAEQGLGIVIKPVSPRQLHEVLRRFLGEAA